MEILFAEFINWKIESIKTPMNKRFLYDLFKNNDRNSKYRRNILLLILSQVSGVLVSLLLVPITLNYLGVKEYGVWITLTTIVSWFAFFDVGLGHGLRNKYAESRAHGNSE